MIETSSGKLDFKTFYLGSDETEARARAARLSELWESVTHSFNFDMEKWSEETLPMAEAIAEGKTVFIVPRPWHWDKNPEQYQQLIAGYFEFLRGISFAAEDSAVLEAGKAKIESSIKDHRENVRRLSRQLGRPIRTLEEVSTHTLYEVIAGSGNENEQTVLDHRCRWEIGLLSKVVVPPLLSGSGRSFQGSDHLYAMRV